MLHGARLLGSGREEITNGVDRTTDVGDVTHTSVGTIPQIRIWAVKNGMNLSFKAAMVIVRPKVYLCESDMIDPRRKVSTT